MEKYQLQLDTRDQIVHYKQIHINYIILNKIITYYQLFLKKYDQNPAQF